MRSSSGQWASTAAGLLTMVISTGALAQDVEPFDPAASNAGDSGGLSVESPFLPSSGGLFGVYATIAEDTAVANHADGSSTSLVSQVVGTTLHGGWTLGSAARVDLLIPLYPWVDAPITNFAGPAFGDIRLQSTIPLVRADRSFALAIVPQIALPTGNRRSLTYRGTHGGLAVALGGETGVGLDWTANIGLVGARPEALRELVLGSSFDLSGALVYRVHDHLRLGGEIDYSLGFASADRRGNTHASGHLFARSISDEGVGVTAGIGTGIVPGVGAPEYRLFLGLSFARLGSRSAGDRDGDGLIDAIDACPDDPEDFDEYEDTDGCPEADNDADGLLDGDDACPMAPEDPDEFEDEDGCPDPDNDADTVLDPDDRCPLEAGLVDNQGCPDGDRDSDGINDQADECPDEAGPEALNGCPDRDQDRVPDVRDKCPDDPIPVDEDPAQSDGCPKRVYITEAKIIIRDKVYFESGKAIIKAESFSLLNDVAALIGQADQIRKVEIQGHTDSQGSETMNQRLSQDRAKAVRTYLIDQGVDADRLTSKGYGESEPIDTNRTEIGRSRNRRVEFKISEQAAAAPTGTAPVTKPTTKPDPAPPVTKPDPAPPVTKPAPKENPWSDAPESKGSPWDE